MNSGVDFSGFIAYIVSEYREGRSTYELAQEFQTYPNKIRKILMDAGEPLRNKSEAQSEVVNKKHPMKGKKHSNRTKEKIAATLKKTLKEKNNGDKHGKGCD